MKKTKKLLALMMVLALSLTALAGCGGGGESGGESGGDATGEVFTYKIQCAYPQGDTSWDLHLPMITEAITEATDGQIQFEIYAPGSICEPEQAPASVAKGILDAALSAPNDTAQIVPAAYAEQGIPFWWQTAEDIYDCLYNAGLMDFLRAEYEKAGIYFGMWDPEGQYMLMTDFPVNTADDLRGKKIRASTTYASLMENMGAAPVTMSGGDMYMGMKLGTIDGYIYSMADLEGLALKEVTTNVMSPAGCAGAPCNIIFNLEKWNSMPQELQDKANQAMEDVFWDVTEAAAQRDEEAKAAAEEYGVTWVEVSEEDMQPFYEAGQKVLEDLAAKYPASAPGFEIIQQWKDAKDAGQSTGAAETETEAGAEGAEAAAE